MVRWSRVFVLPKQSTGALDGGSMQRVLKMVFLAGLMIVSTGTAFAQTETARITGVVTDPQGGVVPGATVTAISRSSGAPRETVTDPGGRYVVANILPGIYDLKVEIAGFKPATAALQIPVG